MKTWIFLKHKRGSVSQDEATRLITQLRQLGYMVVDVELNPVCQGMDLEIEVVSMRSGFFRRMLGAA